MNKDQVKGRIEEIKGKVKEVTGKITDDKNLEVKGNIQKNIGKAQAGFGDLKNDFKKTAEVTMARNALAILNGRMCSNDRHFLNKNFYWR